MFRNIRRQKKEISIELAKELLKNGSMDEDLDPVLRNQLTKVWSELEPCSASGLDHVLTDDKAPVEVLGMSMIDSLISEELAYYKDLFKEKGLKGLIEEIR